MYTGGWNDPCLLIGNTYNGEQMITETQGRAQFSMWAIMASPLLLSQDIANMSTYQFETYTNEEVIAVNQDPLGRSGFRLVCSN